MITKTWHGCVVVIPVGPKAELVFLNDTLRSVFAYCAPGCKIVLIDNTEAGLDRGALRGGENIDILRCLRDPAARPLHGGLYLNLSRAFAHALAHYDFAVLLRLDDDALLVGAGADRQAAAVFGAQPDIGCLGSYRLTCTGAVRDFSPARRILRREVSLRGALRDRARWRILRHLRRLARYHGYLDGEHCLGGAVFFSRECIARFAALGFLERLELRRSNLGEDHIFSLMVKAAGLELADFATDGKPLGLAWQGLPASPEHLLRMGKTIVHSVKGHGAMDQGALRAEFRRLRLVVAGRR